MDSRNNSTKDAEKQGACIYKSEYFTLHSNDVSNEDMLIRSLEATLTHQRKLLKSDPAAENKKMLIALDLIKLTRVLQRNLSLNVLIEASRHNIFYETPAHQLIIDAITQENLYRAPSIIGDHTLEFIRKLEKESPAEFEAFLTNPELLLIWIALTKQVEITKVFKQYFQCDSKYFLMMQRAAAQEIASGQPGKALLCLTLIREDRIPAADVIHIEAALKQLSGHNFAEAYARVINSLRVCLNPTIDVMTQTEGCYINANHIELTPQPVLLTQLCGARFNNAKLDYFSFENIDMTGAQFNNASLSGTILSGTNLSQTSCVRANFSFSQMDYAVLEGGDFSNADFSYANLSRANLKNAIFDNAVFDSTEFINRKKFYDPLALDTEFDRLLKMIQSHRNEARLRIAIVSDIINFTHKPDVGHDTITMVLETAKKKFCGQREPMQALKTGASYILNYTLSSYQNYFFNTGLPALPDFKTEDEKLLLRECEKILGKTPAAQPR